MHRLTAKIKRAIESEYLIEPKILSRMSWGYNSTTFYLEGVHDGKDVKYAVKLSDLSVERLENLKKDIFFANCLSGVINTPVYIKNQKEEYLTVSGETIIKVSELMDGVPPFDMSLDILCQAVGALEKIHKTRPPDFSLPEIEGGSLLLHGDLTPSNMVVSHHRISGVLDFELVCIGPPEWDVSKTCVFSWFRMEDGAIGKIFETAINCYTYKKLDEGKLLEFSREHLKSHLKNVVNHKESYKNRDHWNKEFLFLREKVKVLEDLRF